MTIRLARKLSVLAVLPAMALFALQAEASTIGVAAVVNPDAVGQPPAMERRIIEVGTNMVVDERVTTGPNGQAQLIFNDGSAFSIGPNSELTLDKFVYDPAKGTGQIAMSVTKGVFRFVGGKISKETPVQIKVGTATMGIRGGIATLNVQPGRPVVANFLFGREMTMTQNGVTQVTTRPGTAIEVTPGAPPAPPRPVTATEVRQTNTQLEARSPQQGPGDTAPPGAPQGGQTQGGQAQGGQGQGGAVGGGQTQPNNQGQSGGPPPSGSAIEARLDTGGIVNGNSGQAPGQVPPPPQPGRPIAGPAPAPVLPPPPPPKDPVKDATNSVATQLNNYSGRFLYDNDTTAQIFSSVNTADGTATENATYNQRPTQFQSVTNNGVGTLRTTVLPTGISNTTSIELPLPAGNGAFNLTNIATPYGTFSGKGYSTSNRDFTFYALQDTSNSNAKLVLFGGRPTTAAQFPNSGFSTYILTPAINSLPFVSDGINSNTTLISRTTISPIFTVHGPNLAPSTLDDAGPQFNLSLQATIGISGQGAAQSSYIGGMTSIFGSDPSADSVVLGGGVRGSYRANATSGTQRFTSSVSSASVSNGDSAVFGPTGEYMVLTPDNISFDATGNTMTRVVNTGVQVGFGASPTVSDYYFADRAVKTSNSTELTSASRTTRTMQGYAGGLVERFGNADAILTNDTDSPMNVTIQTNASTNRMQATFDLSSDASNTYKMEFGDLTGAGIGRSAFVNDNIFAARDANSRTTQVNSTNVDVGQSLMVSGRVTTIDSSALPSGVSLCSCEFLQWGWWLTNVRHGGAGPVERVHMGTWVAGVLPNVGDVPLTGTATYNGNVLGNVNNNGNRYVAIGNFGLSWNFGTKAGNYNVTNFDTLPTLTGAVTSANGREFTGNTTASGYTTKVNGSFFSGGADPVKAAAGAFTIDGTNYKASGTFASQKP